VYSPAFYRQPLSPHTAAEAGCHRPGIGTVQLSSEPLVDWCISTDTTLLLSNTHADYITREFYSTPQSICMVPEADCHRPGVGTVQLEL
jgi:hypothetical protein